MIATPDLDKICKELTMQAYFHLSNSSDPELDRDKVHGIIKNAFIEVFQGMKKVWESEKKGV